MSDVLSRARADRNALATQAASLLAEVEKLDVFILLYSKYAADDIGSSATADADSKGAAVERRALKEGSTPYRMAKASADRVALAEMLGDAPPTIKDLLEAVREAGFIVNGERPATGLSSVLSRSDLLLYERGVGWRVTAAYRALSATSSDSNDPDAEDVTPPAGADDDI